MKKSKYSECLIVRLTKGQRDMLDEKSRLSGNSRGAIIRSLVSLLGTLDTISDDISNSVLDQIMIKDELKPIASMVLENIASKFRQGED